MSVQRWQPPAASSSTKRATRRAQSGAGAVRLFLSGKSQVCCVHDREKRIVTTEAQVAELGLEIGILYDPRIHKLQDCACCGNLFFDPSDDPRYCAVCLGPLVHPLGGPLNEPEGVIG